MADRPTPETATGLSSIRRAPVSLGVAGAGAISQVMHLPILSERPDVRIAGLSDPDEHKVRTVAERFGIARILDDERLVTDSEIAGVVICAPNFLHERLAQACLEAGKHVLVERPLALTPDGVKNVLRAAESSGKGVVLGMPHRYRPDVSALQSFVVGGDLGKLGAVRVTWLNRPVHRPGSVWRQSPVEAGGGALMDLGVPALDLALWVTGYTEVDRVLATTHSYKEEVEDEAHVTAVTKEGATLSLSVSWRLHGADDRHRLQVLASDGGAELTPLAIHKRVGGRPIDVTPRSPMPRGGEDMFTNAYRRMLDQFVRVVAGESCAPPPVEQLALMDIVTGAYRSAREGREVHLSPS